MICKEKDAITTQSARIKAASEHEQSVAYFLSQEYKDQSDILIFNDLNLSFDDEKCHIDHLVVYRYGFIVIESQSITGEVRVNSLGDWLKNHNRQWIKMNSPIKLIGSQQRILKSLLSVNASSILGKLIFHKSQLEFDSRGWDQLCGFTSDASINVEGASDVVKAKVIKAEFIVDHCKEIMKLPTGILDSASKFLDSRPGFKAAEIENIRKFLLEADKSCRSMNKATNTSGTTESAINEKEVPVDVVKPEVESLKIKADTFKKESTFKKEIKEDIKEEKSTDVDHLLVCKKCNEKDSLEGKWGKYGYYVFCTKCECNTSMKINCPSCESKNVKNRKAKSNYYVVCLECEKEQLVFKQLEET